LQEAGCDRIFREKSSLQIGYKNVMSLKWSWSMTQNLPSGVNVINIYGRFYGLF
jgi:hypothetical protein